MMMMGGTGSWGCQGRGRKVEIRERRRGEGGVGSSESGRSRRDQLGEGDPGRESRLLALQELWVDLGIGAIRNHHFRRREGRWRCCKKDSAQARGCTQRCHFHA